MLLIVNECVKNGVFVLEKERKREECLLEGEEEKCSMDDRMKDKCLVEREESGGVLNGLLVFHRAHKALFIQVESLLYSKQLPIKIESQTESFQ